jgi:hypothetical protein
MKKREERTATESWRGIHYRVASTLGTNVPISTGSPPGTNAPFSTGFPTDTNSCFYLEDILVDLSSRKYLPLWSGVYGYPEITSSLKSSACSSEMQGNFQKRDCYGYQGIEQRRNIPSVSKYLSPLTFFTTLTILLIQKIMQVSFTMLTTYFIIVGILSLTYPFTHLR